MDLNDIRVQIDSIDDRLLALLNERADLVHEVGKVKRRDGGSIYAPEREEQLLRSLVEKSQGRLPEKAIRAIYREIMSASFALEKGLTIAYFGPAGTYTHEAARLKFGASVDYLPESGINDVFNAVARDRADYGVVPIENSSQGVINHTLDVFVDSPLKICAQILLKIDNNLMARIPRERITRLYSHPQVFGQCRQWIRANFAQAELVEVSSNSRAAALAAEEPNAGALGGKMAAEVHGLNLLERSIQDSSSNTTRFLVLSHETCPPTGDDRTSVMFRVRDKPGALLQALEPFERLKINLSKIESRTSKRRDRGYCFFVDPEGHARDAALVEALQGLGQHCHFVKILGSYPQTH